MSTFDKTSSKKSAVTSPESVSALYASSASVTAFWILIILKESYSSFSNILNFYKPVGPLLGLFLSALLIFALAYFVTNSSLKTTKAENLKKHSQQSITLFMVSTVLVLFMTFPPIFNIFVDILK